jgi:hypothetical protein
MGEIYTKSDELTSDSKVKAGYKDLVDPNPKAKINFSKKQSKQKFKFKKMSSIAGHINNIGNIQDLMQFPHDKTPLVHPKMGGLERK